MSERVGIFFVVDGSAEEVDLFRRSIRRLPFDWDAAIPKLRRRTNRRRVVVTFGDPGMHNFTKADGSIGSFQAWGKVSFRAGTAVLWRGLNRGALVNTIVHEVGGHVWDGYGLRQSQRRAIMALMRPRPPADSGWWTAPYPRMPGECHADCLTELYLGRSPLDTFYERDIPAASFPAYRAILRRAPRPVEPPEENEQPPDEPDEPDPSPPPEDSRIQKLRERLLEARGTIEAGIEALTAAQR